MPESRLPPEEMELAYSLPITSLKEIQHLSHSRVGTLAVLCGCPFALSRMEIAADVPSGRVRVMATLRESPKTLRLHSAGVVGRDELDSLFVGAFSPWPAS